jgi:hypothetical protein
MNDKGKELAAKKIALAIKVMLQENTQEPIYMTWRGDKVEKSQENLIIQAYEGKNNPGSESEMVIQEDSVPQGDRCHNQKENTSSTMPTRRL